MCFMLRVIFLIIGICVIILALSFVFKKHARTILWSSAITLFAGTLLLIGIGVINPVGEDSGKMLLREYDFQKARIQKQISEYQIKLEDKACKLHEKEQALDRLTKDLEMAGSVIQPFRNYKVDFEPPRISGKVPLFGTDKWIETQNQEIAKQFTSTIRKLETLYRNEAERQVKAAQHNVLADYGELNQLRREVKMLSESNDDLKSTLETILDQLSVPSFRSQIFTIADALLGGTPITVSSSGGASSNLPWDGRRPDEEEETYRRRCLLFAVWVVKKQNGMRSYRRR